MESCGQKMSGQTDENDPFVFANIAWHFVEKVVERNIPFMFHQLGCGGYEDYEVYKYQTVSCVQ